MPPLLFASTVVLAGFASLSAVSVFAFVRRGRAFASEEADSLYVPRTAILLSLRGEHDDIDGCLNALLHQDYPAYELKVVVDDVPESTLERISRTLAGQAHASLEPLRAPLESCSRKCSALLQMSQSLSPTVEVVALVDGDVIPHARWLRQLVGPLADPTLGATFGIPWHIPERTSPGSLVRAVWWASTAITMSLGGWVWGGTAALRVDTLKASQIEPRWSRALSSDTTMYGALRSMGLEARWVADLVMLNRETCSVPTFFRQLARYLLVGRLYLPGWAIGLVGAILVTGALLFSIASVAVHAATAAGAVPLPAATVLALYLIAMPALLLVADAAARRTMSRNGVEVPAPTLARRGGLVLAMGAAQALHLLGTIGAKRARRITWRGVRYVVRGPWDVHATLDPES